MESSRMVVPVNAAQVDFSRTLVGDDPVGMLSKLSWEIHQINEFRGKDAIVRSFLSYNAASTAWHIHEWLWKLCPEESREALLDTVNADPRDFAGFKAGLKNSSESFAVCRDLATAGKHIEVRGEHGVTVRVVRPSDDRDVYIDLQWGGQTFRDVQVYYDALRLWIRIYHALGYPQAEAMGKAVAILDND
jgi:hypothetical protein